MSDKKTFLGMPGYGRQTAAAGRALWRARRDMEHVHVCYQNGSLLAANFNALWCEALNMVHQGKRVDYFAMLHDDIGAQDFWLDTLIEEMEAHDLDILGVVVPIKDPRGITSIALDREGDNWRPAARLSMREIHRLPETFTSADVGLPLLLNTGCWVCRFNVEWARKVHFTINDRIAFNTALGCYQPINESEDWYFSRLLHELQLKIGATRKVEVAHRGEVEFTNAGPWGTHEFDRDVTAVSLLPERDRDGFKFPSDVQGWLRFDEGKSLWRLANGKRVLEVGSYFGLSTICLAQSAASVLSVDPHDGRGTHVPQETFSTFIANLERYGVTDKVQGYIGTLADDDFPGGEFDLIFIDGAHDLESVRSDAQRALSLLADGGLLAFHDYHTSQDPDVSIAVDELVAAGGSLLFVEKNLAVVRPPAQIALET
jgi:hypothetical protein